MLLENTPRQWLFAILFAVGLWLAMICPVLLPGHTR